MTHASQQGESSSPGIENCGPAGPVLLISNEFTAVTARKTRTRQGDRLELTVAGSGRRVLLDPMQLEVITHLDSAAFSQLLANTLGSTNTQQSGEENTKI